MTKSAIFIPLSIGCLLAFLLTGFAVYEYTFYWWLWLAICIIVIVILSCKKILAQIMPKTGTTRSVVEVTTGPALLIKRT